MNNKVFVKVIVPEIDKEFDVYLPISKKIGNIIILLNKAINELSYGELELSSENCLYNMWTNETYESDTMLFNTNIRNGTRLVLISK